MLAGSSLLMASLGSALTPADAETALCGAARKLKVVVVGAHPDDPEYGCAGTIALYPGPGQEVVLLGLTRGDAGINGAPHEQAAAIRTAEARKACAILKARPLFAGQIDGDTELNQARYDEFRKLLEAEAPDIVFTQWAVDLHRDHRAAFQLTYDAWHAGGRKFDLYYYEADIGVETQMFQPTDYVDITATMDLKKAACFAHTSQRPSARLWNLHETMNRFRGMECGAALAEGYMRESQNRELGVPQKP
jgi:LmbE family N-acetylglucosaminyl deacetylase